MPLEKKWTESSLALKGTHKSGIEELLMQFIQLSNRSSRRFVSGFVKTR